MRALIIGLGRAGKRHARIAQSLGLQVGAADPNVADPLVRWPYASQALEQEHWDCAVIATPPVLHLVQVCLCLDAGLPVLCEKPLCALGQLEEAKQLPADARVMMFFNYRFHPALLNMRQRASPLPKPEWEFTAWQHRELPSWGLLTDHCSHDLDILEWLAGPLQVTGTQYTTADWGECWDIEGTTAAGEPFHISEGVENQPIDRFAILSTPTHWAAIPRNEQMYEDAWNHFIHGVKENQPFSPGLKEGIRVQELLEETAQLGMLE